MGSSCAPLWGIFEAAFEDIFLVWSSRRKTDKLNNEEAGVTYEIKAEEAGFLQHGKENVERQPICCIQLAFTF